MQSNLYRERQRLDDNKHHFCSNDYLNLSTHPSVKAFFQEGFAKYPVGSGGSMLISGYHAIHEQLERAFANALHTEGALLFNSGYTANLSVMALLAKKQLPCLIDKTIHASFYDGLKLSGGIFSRYSHQDDDSLRKHWKTQVLGIESIFSMSGHLSPLKTIAALNNNPIIVDEAHAFGIWGEKGLGLVYDSKLDEERVPLRIIPLGKAYGAQGAMVAGKLSWIDDLIQVARPYIYSTGMSPAYAYGLYKILPFLSEAGDLRKKLLDNIAYFRHLLSLSHLPWQHSITPIQYLSVGSSQQALDLAQRLYHQGFFVRAIRPPTVPENQAGIRITLNAVHTFTEIEALLTAIKNETLKIDF